MEPLTDTALEDCRTADQEKLPERALLLFLAPFIGPAPFAILERISGVTPVYEHLAIVLGILLEIVAFVWLISTFTFNRTVWPKLCRQWQRHFVCLRCGQIYVSG